MVGWRGRAARRSAPEEDSVSDRPAETVFIISSDTFGRGDDELGRQLMAKFVLQLSTQSPKPHAIAFYNSGVKLLAEGSPCLEGFRVLERDGTDLLACGTCVDFFQLRGRIGAGHVTDMREIVATLQAAPKVVTV
jgi:selenium metabolism protein YedF